LSNQDLLVAMQYLKVEGKGTVDLVNSAMDYRLNAKVLRIPAEGTDAADLRELVDAEIPVKVTGPLASPTVRPDIESLVKAKVKEVIDQQKEKLQQSLQDKLKDLLNR
jgi:AsmA protein